MVEEQFLLLRCEAMALTRNVFFTDTDIEAPSKLNRTHLLHSIGFYTWVYRFTKAQKTKQEKRDHENSYREQTKRESGPRDLPGNEVDLFPGELLCRLRMKSNCHVSTTNSRHASKERLARPPRRQRQTQQNNIKQQHT